MRLNDQDFTAMDANGRLHSATHQKRVRPHVGFMETQLQGERQPEEGMSMTDVDMMMAYLAAAPAPSSAGEFGDVPPALDTYIPSCARSQLLYARPSAFGTYDAAVDGPHITQGRLIQKTEKIVQHQNSNPKSAEMLHASAEKAQVLPKPLQFGLCHSPVTVRSYLLLTVPFHCSA